MDKYEYDIHLKLTKACEYDKKGSDEEYKLRDCKKFIYKDEILKEVISLKEKVLFRYKKRSKGILEKYDHKNILRATFKNGLAISKVFDSDNYQYDYNSKGQMILSRGKDKDGNFTGVTLFTYEKGLLIEVIYKNQHGKVEGVEKYEYQYYK